MKHKKVSLLIIALSFISVIILTSLKGNLSNLSAEELGKSLGIITLLPTIIAILLAFVTHNVLISLLIGFISGVIIITISTASNITAIPLTFVTSIAYSVKDVLFDLENIEI